VIETNMIIQSNPTVYIAFYVFALLVAPVSWACLFQKTEDYEILSARDSTPDGKTLGLHIWTGTAKLDYRNVGGWEADRGEIRRRFICL
jgi:hypothetical protein